MKHDNEAFSCKFLFSFFLTSLEFFATPLPTCYEKFLLKDFPLIKFHIMISLVQTSLRSLQNSRGLQQCNWLLQVRA